jgi:molybdopterin molybdotransferase
MVMDKLQIGLAQALALTLERLAPLGPESVPLDAAVDRILAEDLPALVDSPSVDASMKDGYALQSALVAGASPQSPVALTVCGVAAAGGHTPLRIAAGEAMRILTGARLPENADAVLAEEFTHRRGSQLLATNWAEPGRNILRRGSDAAKGTSLAKGGTRLCPGLLGLLAAGGYHRLPVRRQPRVALVATGDEVVAPGLPLREGALYASNLTTLSAWCHRFGWPTSATIVADQPAAIRASLIAAAEMGDVLVTSGGAWTGDRDLVAKILVSLGWEEVFHRIRIGPGKAVGFGLLHGKPVFILPGGPPSNLLGFLQIALPGLQHMAGLAEPGLPRAAVRLAVELCGRDRDWTQFIFGTLEKQDNIPLFQPLNSTNRLQSMAEAEAVVAIVEGQTRLAAGSLATAQLLT